MDDYTCTLEDKYIKKAKNDLNEVPSKRLTAVQALRDWIIKQKHLKYDTSNYVNSLSFFIFEKILIFFYRYIIYIENFKIRKIRSLGSKKSCRKNLQVCLQ